jgi:hypothetical protein
VSRDYLVNSEQSKNLYIKRINELWDKGKEDPKYRYMSFPAPRLGEDRSISMNSLFHVWLTEYAAHLLRCDKRDISAGILEGMKRKVKERYYQTTQADFMVHVVVNPFDVSTKKKDYTSSAGWKTGEMKDVLDKMQMYAAEDGLVLESKGEHKKLTREETST